MGKQWVVSGIVLLCLTTLGSGCGNAGKRTTAEKSKAERPKKELPPLTVTVIDLNLQVFDEKNQLVLTLKAKAAGGNQSSSGSGDSNTVVVQNGDATLYQKGVATATMTADTLTANREAGTVVATGHVTTHSLTEKSSPTVRADRMDWEHDKNLLTGSGNVVMTAEPAYTLYAKSFKADTKLSEYHVTLGDTPSTGKL